MQIAHIFNIVDSPRSSKSAYIDTQQFNGAFWKSNSSNYEEPKELNSDFAKLYYTALTPVKDKDVISKYDDEKLKSIVNSLGDDLLLISGDFWGIQSFIFDGITSSKAAKILRSRSAMVLLITYSIAKEIEKEFKGSQTILFGAGKFLIIAKNEKIDELKKLQEKLDNYFMKNFFGQNGFILSYAPTKGSEILNSNIEQDLINLAIDNENKKYNKFDLSKKVDEFVAVDIFKEAKKDDEICEFCSKRLKTHKIDSETKACSVCYNQIELGKQLTKKDYITIFDSTKQESKDNIHLIKIGETNYYAKLEDKPSIDGDSFDITFNDYFDHPKWALGSYIPKDENKEIKTFKDYIEKDGKSFSSGLMALKADIDLLGNTFRKLYKEDFRLFNRLSREVEYFFSNYISSLIAKKDNIYTVFAGGDDLFLIGEYREIVKLAKEIRKEFLDFSLKKTTISMGLVMFKPTTPINFVSQMADEAEKRAKKERDSIDIFGVSIKFDEFNQMEKDFNEVVEFLEKYSQDTTTLYYRFIEFCDMKENIDKALDNKDYKFNPSDALWKSQLNYIIRKNINKDDNDSNIYDKINKLIEKGKKFKPLLFLKIYNNRDKKKEI